MPPRKRRHANVWRDATEEELKHQLEATNNYTNPNDNFFDDFMRMADPELMKNLNPTILNAL